MTMMMVMMVMMMMMMMVMMGEKISFPRNIGPIFSWIDFCPVSELKLILGLTDLLNKLVRGRASRHQKLDPPFLLIDNSQLPDGDFTGFSLNESIRFACDASACARYINSYCHCHHYD